MREFSCAEGLMRLSLVPKLCAQGAVVSFASDGHEIRLICRMGKRIRFCLPWPAKSCAQVRR